MGDELLRSADEIRAGGAAWVTEAELEWLCARAAERDAALAREAALREAAEAVLREQGSNAPVKQAHVALRAALASSPPAAGDAKRPRVPLAVSRLRLP